MTFANVVSVLALFLALGGTGYAAATLAKNSVGTKQLKKNAVTSPKVKNHSLKAVDFGAGQLPAGPRGPKGDKGTKGDPGANGRFGPVTVRSFTAAADLAMGAKASYNAFCPAGEIAIGGGGRGDDTQSEKTNVGSSRPAISATNTNPPADGQGFTGWRLTVNNVATAATTGIRPQVWVICTPAP
jgi:hypothetical protein